MIALTVDLGIPFLMQKTLDDGLSHSDIGLIWLLVLGQLALFTGSTLMSAANSYIVNRFSLKLSTQAIDKYLSRLVSLPQRFFDSRVNADLIQKTNDQECMQHFLLESPTSFLVTILNICIFTALLLWFNPLIYIAFIIITAFGMIWESWILNKQKSTDYDLRSAQGENHNQIYEIINGISELKAHNATQRRIGLWRELRIKFNKLSNKTANFTLLRQNGSSFIYHIRDLLITGLCASLIVSGDLTIGAMISVTYISGRLSAHFSGISSAMTSFQRACISLDRTSDVFEEKSEKDTISSVPLQNSDIRINNITFCYPGSNSTPAISNLSMTIQKNHTTAIVGPSGCGKHSIIRG